MRLMWLLCGPPTVTPHYALCPSVCLSVCHIWACKSRTGRRIKSPNLENIFNCNCLVDAWRYFELKIQCSKSSGQHIVNVFLFVITRSNPRTEHRIKFQFNKKFLHDMRTSYRRDVRLQRSDPYCVVNDERTGVIFKLHHYGISWQPSGSYIFLFCSFMRREHCGGGWRRCDSGIGDLGTQLNHSSSSESNTNDIFAPSEYRINFMTSLIYPTSCLRQQKRLYFWCRSFVHLCGLATMTVSHTVSKINGNLNRK